MGIANCHCKCSRHHTGSLLVILAVGVRSIKIDLFSIQEVVFFGPLFGDSRPIRTFFYPFWPKTTSWTLENVISSVFFQSVQRHPTFFTISQDFSQPFPPPNCPSRSEISGSGLIFPKYWFQFKKFRFLCQNQILPESLTRIQNKAHV